MGSVVAWYVTVVLAAAVAVGGQECATVRIDTRQGLISPEQRRKTFMGQYVRVTNKNVVAGAYGFEGFAGSVEIFEKDPEQPGQWKYAQTLRPGDPHTLAYFGLNVDALDDTIIVGSPFHKRIQTKGGAAYLYDRGNNGRFQEIQRLRPPDTVKNGLFGYSVAIADPLTVLVGARRAYDWIRLKNKAGAIYLYRRQAFREKFKLWQKISFDGRQATDEIRQVNDVLVTGAPRMGGGIGLVYSYIKKADGRFGFQQEILPPTPADIKINRDNLHYGEGLALSGDTQLFVLGAENAISRFGQTGVADLYIRQANGTYSWKQHLYPPNGPDDMQYGQRVAILTLPVGRVLLIGAWRDTAGGIAKGGAVYIWTQCYDGVYRMDKAVSLEQFARFDDNFGKSVNGLRDTFAVGALRRDTVLGTADGLGYDDGAVFVYKYSLLCPRSPCPNGATVPST